MFRRRSLRKAPLLTLGALLLALAVPASAFAAWSEPKYLNSAFIPVSEPAQVEMDGDGDSYFVFADGGGRVQVKKYTATGASAGTQTLTPRPTNPEQELSAELPNLGVNDAGDSAYAWLTSNNAGTRSIVQARTRSASGQLGPVKTLVDIGQSEGEIELPEVAVDADGDAIVAWTQQSTSGAERGLVRARTLSKTGNLGSTQTISADAAGTLAEFVQVGMQPDGDAVFAWQYSTNNNEGQIQTRTLKAAGTLTKTRNVSGFEAIMPDFDIAPDGDAIFAWVQADPFAGGLQAKTRTMAEDGTFGRNVSLSPRGGESLEVQAALNSNGGAAFAYSLKDPVAGKTKIYGRALSPTGDLSKTHSLSGNSTEDAIDPDVGISNSGRAVFSWMRHAGASDRVESKTLTASGTLGTLRTVGSGASLFEPHLAVAPSGQAAATWLDLDLKRAAAAFGP
jgi:hypothetical protein